MTRIVGSQKRIIMNLIMNLINGTGKPQQMVQSSYARKPSLGPSETAASRAVPEAFVAADVQHIVGLQRKLFAASVLLAGVYLFAEPLVRGFAALVGAACFGFVAAAVAGVKPPSLSKIKGPLHLLFLDQALFAPPKKDAVAPPSF